MLRTEASILASALNAERSCALYAPLAGRRSLVPSPSAGGWYSAPVAVLAKPAITPTEHLEDEPRR